jgi:hypothetical protein
VVRADADSRDQRLAVVLLHEQLARGENPKRPEPDSPKSALERSTIALIAVSQSVSTTSRPRGEHESDLVAYLSDFGGWGLFSADDPGSAASEGSEDPLVAGQSTR